MINKCNRGHFYEVVGTGCPTCKKNRYYKNRKSILEKIAQKYKLNREEKLLYARSYRIKNRDTIKLKLKEYYNLNREKIISQVCQYQKDNKGKINAKIAKRNALKLSATPKWVDTKELEKIYERCPEGMEVDHIVPLQGKDVRGLHVPWNLQYLTRSENASKSNKV